MRVVLGLLVGVFFSVSGIVYGGMPPIKSSPITAPCPVATRFTLWDQEGGRSVVLLPDDQAFAGVAEQLRRKLSQLSGKSVSAQSEGSYRELPDGVRTLFVFGNFTTGPLVRRLYANHLVASDGEYPGEGGFELRTIPGAMDTGMDIVFFGASSVADMSRAVDEFGRVLSESSDGSIPMLHMWRPAGWVAPASLTDADIEKSVAQAGKTLSAFRSSKVNQYRSVCQQFEASAKKYYLSGDDSYGRECAGLLRFLAKHYPDISHPPTFTLAELVIAIDQCEESAGLTDGDRVLAAEWLRQMVEDAMVFWELRDPVRRYRDGERRPIWNHQTYPALGVGLAAQFLRSHYEVQAADYWTAVMENLFAGQINSPEPLEDSANYQWSVPDHMIRYVLSTGRLTEYLTNGVLRECLDYAIASHDAFGNEATHGDAWQPFGSVAGKLFRLGAALYNDGRYMWLLELTQGSSAAGMWSYAPSCEAVVPKGHVGLRTFVVDPLRASALGIEGIPEGRILDKAVFRSGWGKEDDYMMLDGLHVGNHKHVDGNAIIRYSQGDHYWLVDMDYIRSEPRHHNSLAWVRDGVCPDLRSTSHRDAQVISSQPFAAELLASGGTDRVALTWSRMTNCGGANWDRAIFWRAGDCFVVVDTLTELTADASYRSRCFWRTLGEVKVEGNVIQVTQGKRLAKRCELLTAMDDDGRRVVEFSAPGAELVFPLNLKKGEYRISIVAKGTGGGSDSFWFQVGENDPIAHHIPIDEYSESSSTWEKTDTGTMLPVEAGGEFRCRLSLREGPGPRLDRIVVRSEDGTEQVLEGEDLLQYQKPPEDIDKHFFIVNGDGARIKVRRHLDYGHGGPQGYYAAYPYADKTTAVITQTRDGQLQKGGSLRYVNLLFPSDEGQQRLDIRACGENQWLITGDHPAILGLGPADLSSGLHVPSGLYFADQNGLLQAGTDGKTDFSPLPTEAFARLLASARDRVRGLPAMSEPVPRVVAPPLEPAWHLTIGGVVSALTAVGDGVVAGTETGRVVFGRGGKQVWSRDFGERVRSVGVAEGKGQSSRVLVGLDDGRTMCLDSDTGNVQWEYTCDPFHGRTGSVGTIFGADLDADGVDEVVAGSDNWHYHALSSSGSLLWRTDTTHASTVGVAGDVDGDGKDEILAGTEYGWPRMLGADGKLIQRLYGGPVTSAVAMIDTDGDGNPEPYIALEDSYVRRIEVGKGFVWNTNCGGTVTSISPMDVNKDATPELVCTAVSGTVCAVDSDGEVLWRRLFPDSVLCGSVADGLLAIGCDDGHVYMLNGSGQTVVKSDLGGIPRALASVRGMVVCAVGEDIVALPVPGLAPVR